MGCEYSGDRDYEERMTTIPKLTGRGSARRLRSARATTSSQATTIPITATNDRDFCLSFWIRSISSRRQSWSLVSVRAATCDTSQPSIARSSSWVPIFQTMCEIAQRNLRSFRKVRLTKIDGTHLPFEDRSVDLSFTVTVLQHITDAAMLEALVKDICRVTRDTVVIMEDIGQCEQLGGEGAGINRTVGAYESLLAKHGFQLGQTLLLNTKVSRRWYEFSWRAYRRVFAHDHEGDRINFLGKVLIGLPLILTRALDDFLAEDQNLAKLTFVRKS